MLRSGVRSLTTPTRDEMDFELSLDATSFSGWSQLYRSDIIGLEFSEERINTLYHTQHINITFLNGRNDAIINTHKSR